MHTHFRRLRTQEYLKILSLLVQYLNTNIISYLKSYCQTFNFHKLNFPKNILTLNNGSSCITHPLHYIIQQQQGYYYIMYYTAIFRYVFYNIQLIQLIQVYIENAIPSIIYIWFVYILLYDIITHNIYCAVYTVQIHIIAYMTKQVPPK